MKLKCISLNFVSASITKCFLIRTMHHTTIGIFKSRSTFTRCDFANGQLVLPDGRNRVASLLSTCYGFYPLTAFLCCLMWICLGVDIEINCWHWFSNFAEYDYTVFDATAKVCDFDMLWWIILWYQLVNNYKVACNTTIWKTAISYKNNYYYFDNNNTDK